MDVLVLDTETSGLIKNSLLPIDKQPQCIEFYGMSVDLEGKDLERNWHSLFNPGKKISAEVTSITRITDAMVKDAPSFHAKAVEIKQLIESHSAVVAHNLSYDRAIIDFEMRRCGLKVNWPTLICTVESSEHYKGFRLNLNALHQYLFDEEFTGAHRAEQDVRALARCYAEMVKRGDL